MLFICILGPYTGPDVLTVAGNCRRGHAMAIELLKKGYAVHDCWLDLHWALIADLPLCVFKNNTLEHIRRSDAVIVTEGWQKSKGFVNDELPVIQELNIPMFETVDDLELWRIEHERRSN